jgi:tetratricopeptide (TPR) repeat protein
MKKSFLSGVLTVGFLITSTVFSFSQCKEFKWPEDGAMKAKAEEKVTLYTDYKNNKEYRKAATHLRWLLTNIPDFNTSIYINGTDIYDELAKAEKDAAQRVVYVDSLLLLYDMRAKYCGEEGNVLNRKLFDFAKYYGNSSRAPEVLKLAEKVLELNGNSMIDETPLVHMQMLQINYLKKNITVDDVMNSFDKLNEVLDAKIKKAQSEGKKIDKFIKIKQSIEDTLIKTIGPEINCDFVKQKWSPKFKANPSDVQLAKKMFFFMLQSKCTDDPLWLEVGEAIHNSGEKDFGLAKNLGSRYVILEKYDKAEFFFKEALELAPTSADKADMYLNLGGLTAKKGNKVSARDFYRQALGADPNNKEAYEKIGDLYYGSFEDCAKKDNQADDRLVFLAAYDMYQRAGNSKKMAMAKEAFPSKEDIFLKNYSAGQSMKVNCWINEATTLRTRD